MSRKVTKIPQTRKYIPIEDKLVNHTVTDIQSDQPPYFNVNSDVHSSELSDLADRFQCVQRVAQDQTVSGGAWDQNGDRQNGMEHLYH